MNAIANIVQAFMVISACWAIIAGIDAWKREFIGKRQIELAEEVLAKYYEVKDAIAFIRNIKSDEGKSRQRQAGETESESVLLDRGYVVYERYETKKKTFLDFNILKYRFMAAFGKETEEIFADTNKILNTIFVSAYMLSTHYWQRQGRVQMSKEEFQKHLKEMERHEGIFWDMYDENDEIRKKLELVQGKLDKITKPCFEEQMGTYSKFIKKW